MKKNIIYSLALFLGLGVAIISCSKNEEVTAPEEPVVKNSYSANIPASIASTKAVADGGVATFKTTEKVYVCNVSNGNAIDANYLSPDANAAHVSLVGDLTGTYAAGNTLKLMYNSDASGIVDYNAQNGTIAGVKDAGIATVNVTSIEGSAIKTPDASFQNLQSIFKFTFKHNGTILNVKRVVIASSSNNLVSSYDAVSGTETYGAVTISNTSAQSTIYAALRFTQTPNDPIAFTVIDADNKVYQAIKTAPASGFAINKFFTSIVTVIPSEPFAVSDSKQIYFSYGNLMRTGSIYSFETNPYPYEFESGKFAGWGYSGDPATANPTSYFQWSEVISDGVTSDSPRLFDINGFSNWRALTWAEWGYIFRTRTMLNEADGVKRYYLIRDANGIGGCLITPYNATASDVIDLSTGSSSTPAENIDYKDYVIKGFVYLPTSGKYYSSGAYNVNNWGNVGTRASYWSTTEDSSDTDLGDELYFFSTSGYAMAYPWLSSRDKVWYVSVRLVRDAN